MKTTQELDELIEQIGAWPVDMPTLAQRRKLLRAIQIDALREARNIMDSHARREEYASLSLPEIDRLIRDLELR